MLTHLISSQRHILPPDFQAFILIFPDDGGIKFEEFRGELAARCRYAEVFQSIDLQAGT